MVVWTRVGWEWEGRNRTRPCTPGRERGERAVGAGLPSPCLEMQLHTQTRRQSTHTSAVARKARQGPWRASYPRPPSNKYPYRVSSQVRGEAQSMVELVQALVEASRRVTGRAGGGVRLHKEGGPFAQQAAGLVDPLFFRRVKLKATAAAHAAAGGGDASLSSWLWVSCRGAVY